MVAFWPAASINRLDAISVIQTVVPKHESLMSPTRIIVTHSIVRQIHLIAAVGIHAYSSYKNTQLVLCKAAMPYIAFRVNAKANHKSPAAWRRMFHLYSYNQEEFMRHYPSPEASRTIRRSSPQTLTLKSSCAA